MIQLEQSPFLSLIPDWRIHQILKLMGKKAEMPLTAAVANEVCERTGSAAFLEGSIALLGTRYVLGLRATNCHTGELLDEEQVQFATKEQTLNAPSDVARKFRARVGESVSGVAKHDTPLADATTHVAGSSESVQRGFEASRFTRRHNCSSAFQACY